MKDMRELSKRSFIYCPICGKHVEPIFKGGTDKSMNGTYTCDECFNQFTFIWEFDKNGISVEDK